MGNYIYYAENSLGEHFCHYERSFVLSWYKYNQGNKIYSKTKDLFPEINVFVDEAGINIDDIRREEDVLNTTSAAQRKAVLKYDKKNTKQIMLKLNLTTDKEIIEKLNSVEHKQTYIKELIKKDLLSK